LHAGQVLAQDRPQSPRPDTTGSAQKAIPATAGDERDKAASWSAKPTM
jgi:hypothetical protein